MKKISGNKSEIFVNCTQEKAAAYLKARYGLPKKYFIKELQRLTKNGWKYEIKSFMK